MTERHRVYGTISALLMEPNFRESRELVYNHFDNQMFIYEVLPEVEAALEFAAGQPIDSHLILVWKGRQLGDDSYRSLDK